MERAKSAFIIGLLVFVVPTVRADEPKTPAPTGEFLRSPLAPRLTGSEVLQSPALLAQEQPGKTQKDKKDKKDKKDAQPDDLAFAAPTPTEAPAGLNPNMIGDWGLGIYSFVLIGIPTTAQVVVTIPGKPGVPSNRPPLPQQQIINVPTTVFTQVRVNVNSRGGTKIAENESPAPQDRIFFTWNYYNNVGGPNHGSDIPRTVNQTFLINGALVTAPVTVPGVPAPRYDLHRETFGFEKTFFDGNASIGMRLPIYQQQGDPIVNAQEFGDLTVILKYAPFLDREAGNAISLGLAITAPTGPGIPTPTGEINSTLLQPYLGAMFSGDAFFVQGFTSICVPTDSRDCTLMFNDIGVGYWLYRGGDGLVSFIVPTFEAHLTTPLDHRSITDTIYATDLLVLTGGVNVGLGQRSLLTVGVATPVTGPRLFSVEAIVQFNIRF